MSQPASTPSLSLVHLARPPRTPFAGRPPLLVQLHGVGSHERDLFSFADLLDPRFLVLSVRAPLVRGPDSFAWFDILARLPDRIVVDVEELRSSRDRLVQFIGEAVEAYDAAPERVYLLGFSQGAIIALTTALSHPTLLAGVAALSGRLPDEVVAWSVPAAELAGLPVLVTHGRYDKVISLSHARAARQVLKGLPLDLTYREYAMGHEINTVSLRDALAWLTARLDGPRRSPAPAGP